MQWFGVKSLNWPSSFCTSLYSVSFLFFSLVPIRYFSLHQPRSIQRNPHQTKEISTLCVRALSIVKSRRWTCPPRRSTARLFTALWHLLLLLHQDISIPFSFIPLHFLLSPHSSELHWTTRKPFYSERRNKNIPRVTLRVFTKSAAADPRSHSLSIFFIFSLSARVMTHFSML